jgi:hypothetical protein
LPHDTYESAQEFLSQMDSGLFDGKFAAEVQKLSSDQIKELTEILLRRSPFSPQEVK